MEVKQGYKETEIGIIPEDWEVVHIGNLFEFKNGLNKEKQYFGKGTPIVNYMDVYKNNGLYANDIQGKVTLSRQEIKNYEVKKGDVFFTRTSETVDEIGVSSVMLEDVKDTVFSGFILRARPKNNSLFDNYKKYSFSTQQVRKEITNKSTYTTRALTNGRLLSQVKIPLPSYKEQTAIATALSDTDALIESLEKLIAKKRLIKQGAMQELLKPKEGWEVKRFKDIFIKYPSKKHQINSSEYEDAGMYPIIDQGKKSIVGYSDDKSKVFNCPINGIIVFGDHTRILKYVNFNFIVGADGTQLISTLDDYNNLFFYYLLLTKEIPNTGYNRHFKFLLEMDFCIPLAFEEQTHISTILSDMDEEIDVLEDKLEKYRKIKVGMMQQLLTGKIRLV